MRMSPGGSVGVGTSVLAGVGVCVGAGVLVGMGVWVLAGVGVCVGAGVLVGMGVWVLAGVGVCVGVRSPHAIRATWTASRSATAAPAASEAGLVALLRGEGVAEASRSRGASEALHMIVGGSFTEFAEVYHVPLLAVLASCRSVPPLIRPLFVAMLVPPWKNGTHI